ncbi:MAG: hypothetical protein JWM50_2124 [Microbacteriaceae bacterium]|jgi:hypothetical protein|nr:hypothetical protein [Microbacteriaceae bacterium]
MRPARSAGAAGRSAGLCRANRATAPSGGELLSGGGAECNMPPLPAATEFICDFRSFRTPRKTRF